MRLRQQLLTKNECFQVSKAINPKGIMVHSTGVNNPNVSRYVPGDAEIGQSGQPRWNVYHPGGKDIGPHPYIYDRATGRCKTCGGRQVCVHAFVGKFADGGVGTVQTLPWTVRGWHSSSGKNGSAQDTHIGFEICEDGLSDPAYFKAVYQEAAELTAYLCKEYGLDPLADGVVICHQEGYRRGLASNHGDVLHWFPKMGKTMDDFRADVARLMEGEDETVSYEQWKEYMERYEKEKAALPASDWAKPYIQDAIDAGAFSENGAGTIDRPKSWVTREELATVVSSKK